MQPQQSDLSNIDSEANDQLTTLENYKYEKTIFGTQDMIFYKPVPVSSPSRRSSMIFTDEYKKKYFCSTNKRPNLNNGYNNYVNNRDYGFLESIDLPFTKNELTITYHLDEEGCEDKEYFFTNLRLRNHEDLSKIEYVELVCGGNRLDRIYPDFFRQMQRFYKMDETKSYVPFHLFKNGYVYNKNQRTKIIIKLKRKDEDIVLQVDRFKNANQDKGVSLEVLMYQMQNIINMNETSVNLNFNHCVYFLIAN